MVTRLRLSSLCTAMGFMALAVTAQSQAADLDRGAEIFAANCVACHGAAGSPDPDSPLVKNLGVVPADFSDTLFNSREGESEWKLVATHGGASLGFSEVMPAFGGSLSEEDIDNTLAYIKTLGGEHDYPDGSLNLFLPIRTKKAFPEDEWVWKQRYTDQEGDSAFKQVLEIEKRFGKAGQGILELVHEREGSVSELSEAEIGYKQALLFDTSQILSAAAVVAIPVEADGDGELLTYLAYGRQLSPSWIFQGSLRLKFPFEGASDGEAELAGIVHWVHSPWARRVFPALEVVATNPFRSANGDLEWTAMPQVRIGLTRGGHVALNLGVEFPLSDQTWDRRYYMTLLWDFADGSFFQGW